MKIGERGQITIPKRIRDQYGLHKNTEVEVTADENGIHVTKRVGKEHPIDKIRGILRLKDAQSVDEYIEDIRGR